MTGPADRPLVNELEPHGVTIAPNWGALVTSQNGLIDIVELETPGIAPDAYPHGRHAIRSGMFPGGMSFAPTGGTDSDRLAVNVIAALAIAGMHEGLEWVRANGQQIAEPHPDDPDFMWDWLQRRMVDLVEDYRAEFPIDDGSGPSPR